jgi:hypothetical protein
MRTPVIPPGLVGLGARVLSEIRRAARRELWLWFQLGNCYMRLSFRREAIDALRQSVRSILPIPPRRTPFAGRFTSRSGRGSLPLPPPGARLRCSGKLVMTTEFPADNTLLTLEEWRRLWTLSRRLLIPPHARRHGRRAGASLIEDFRSMPFRSGCAWAN